MIAIMDTIALMYGLPTNTQNERESDGKVKIVAFEAAWAKN